MRFQGIFLFIFTLLVFVEGSIVEKPDSKISKDSVPSKNETETKHTHKKHRVMYDNDDDEYSDDDDDDYDDDDEYDDDDYDDDDDDDDYVDDPIEPAEEMDQLVQTYQLVLTDPCEAEENFGHHYFQGDILSTDEQMSKIKQLLFDDSNSTTRKRALIRDVERLWPNAVVPYKIQDGMDEPGKTMVNGAIKHWQDRTCLRFQPRKDEKDFVHFKRGMGCASYVGRMGGEQRLIIGGVNLHKCRLGNIIHEIGHTIGFFHEQSRPDRMKYVDINWKNVIRSYKVNFKRFGNAVVDSRDVPYDYGSIMHYPNKIFGKDHSIPTVVPKEANATIGQRVALSDKDIIQAKKLYNCPGASQIRQW